MTDIVVVGGGVTGLTTACLLARSDFSVTGVAAQPAPAAPPRGAVQPRVLALGRASLRILRRCGAGAHLQAERLQPWTRMRVWERQPWELAFCAEDRDAADLGCIAEHAHLVFALARAARDAGVRMQPGALESLQTDAGAVAVRLREGAALEARLVVGADGARSRVRECANLAWRPLGRPEGAVVCEIETERAFAPTAWQRFAPQGPIALLPLCNRHYALVWSCADAQRKRDLADAAFAQALEEQLGPRFGALHVHGPRTVFALTRGFAPRWCRPGVALLGDAAHVVHPLAGLGQNLGLMDAAVLQEEWAAHPRAWRALRAYERRRKGPVRATQALLEGLRAGFGMRGCSAVRARALARAGGSRARRRCLMHLADPGMDAPEWLRRPASRSERTPVRH